MTSDKRLDKFLDIGREMLDYFESNLGRIEILGSSKRIERIYFNIQESSLEQWEKPQIRDSKRQFISDVIIGEGGEKGSGGQFFLHIFWENLAFCTKKITVRNFFK
jgi:ryanodine receptor 2